MLPFALLLAAAYLAFLLWEKQANDRALRSFRHVIHVSGIRGKTGVCRLLDAHLREPASGYSPKPPGLSPPISTPRAWSTRWIAAVWRISGNSWP